MGTAKLVHYDDHKEKRQSHEIYLKYPADIYGVMRFEGRGYGATIEEAFADFKSEYERALKEAQALATLILDTDTLWPPVEVNCSGKEV